MVAAFRTLWTALISLYEETLVLVGANIAAVVLNLPLGLLLYLIALLVPAFESDVARQYLVAAIGMLMPFVPSPGNIALAGLTRVAAGPDVPRFFQFRQTLQTYWRLALRATGVSLLVSAALVWNLVFYASLGGSWLQFISILWVYALVFWLSVHIYLIPLTVHVGELRLFDLYRRSVFIALGHPIYTLVLLVPLVLLGLASVVFLPVYLLVAPAFISLTQAHALREIRRRHGDLVIETEEELSRL
jgi:uncharacterized membrane protein YesL